VDRSDAERESMMWIATLLLATKLDACNVLTKADIAAVQGETFTAAKLSNRPGATTCFYQLPSFTNSVSVDLMRSGGRAFWEQHFERENETEEPGEKTPPPKKISGVGSEAMWVGSRAAGSLYVRKGDKLLRVSVGGPGDDAAKIAKSKKLAVRALKRL
jgi:hypothetical protein